MTPVFLPTASTIHVLDVVDGQINAFHAFIDSTLFELFGLPLEPVS
jgi:hypothetical protein